MSSRTLFRNAGVVAAATLVSRILGFVRDVIVAFALGAGPVADAFFVAFRIPNLLRRLFGEGSLTMAFVPVYSEVREKQGEEAANRMMRSAFMWVWGILIVMVLVVELLASPVTFAIAPGFADRPEVFGLTTDLLRICFPYIILISGVALCMGVLNSRGYFLGPALAPSFLNIALIGSALTGYFLGYNVAVCMAFGVLVGGVFQLGLQLPFLRKSGVRIKGAWKWKDPAVAKMGLLMLPTVFGAAVYQINILMGTLLASYLPEGSVSWLYYADRLVQFPLGVFGIAVSTAALPDLSRLSAQGDMKGFFTSLRAAMGLTLFICLPSMAGLLGLAEPIIELLFARGAFDAASVAGTSAALLAYGWGLPFIALSRPLISAFYARQDTRTPVVVAVICLGVNIGLGWFLMQSYGHVGLATAVSVSSLVNCILLYGCLSIRERKERKADFRWPLAAGTLFKCTLLCVGVYYGAFYSTLAGKWWPVAIPVLAALYFFGAYVLRCDEFQVFKGIVSRKLNR
ncbi:MAG: murein biosynthesis integral membrane protein MurJ [Desulfovibrio sp.]